MRGLTLTHLQFDEQWTWSLGNSLGLRLTSELSAITTLGHHREPGCGRISVVLLAARTSARTAPWTAAGSISGANTVSATSAPALSMLCILPSPTALTVQPASQ